MSKIWPKATIRELLARAELEGMSVAELATTDAACKFRYAIYNFRKRHDLGKDTIVTIEGSKVVVTKIDKPEVTILQEQEG